MKRGRRDREEERKIIINKCIVFNFVAKIRALIWSELCNGKSNRIRWCIIFVYFAKKYILFLFYTLTFTKHPHQFIYYTLYFIYIIIFLFYYYYYYFIRKIKYFLSQMSHLLPQTLHLSLFPNPQTHPSKSLPLSYP